MKKRSILIVALLAASMSFLFANGEKESSSGSKIKELTFVETMTSPSRTKVLQDLIARYESNHPDIKINLISPPYEQSDNKLTLMLNSNQAVDIAEVRDYTVKQFVNNKKLRDLTPYVEKWDEYSDLLPLEVTAAKTVDNTPYFLPQGFYVKALFVRKDILAKNGYGEDDYPKTVEDLFLMCKEITAKDPNQYGLAFRGKANTYKCSDPLIFSYIPNVNLDNGLLTTDGKLSYDTPEGRNGLAAFKDVFQNAVPADGINWGFNEQVNAFISGTCPFLVQDPDTLSMFEGQLTHEQYTIIPMPVGSKTKVSYIDYGFSGLGIPTTAKYPEEAWDFVKFMLSAETNAEFTKSYGPLPVHTSTYEKDDYFSSGDYAPWAYMMSHPETYKFFKYPLDAEQYPGWAQTQETSMQAYLLDKASLDDTINGWKAYWGL